MKKYKVYRIKDNKFLDSFDTRKDAVFYCKVSQSLPLIDYQWDDEFDIRIKSVGKQKVK